MGTPRYCGEDEIPGIVKSLGFGHLLLQSGLVQCALAVFYELADNAGQTLLKPGVIIKVVFIESLENRFVGILRGFQVPPPGEIFVQID